MYSDDGAGRTVFGPDGSQHKVDLSIRRPNDIRRTPASQIAAKCVDAIVARRRSVDFSSCPLGTTTAYPLTIGQEM